MNNTGLNAKKRKKEKKSQIIIPVYTLCYKKKEENVAYNSKLVKWRILFAFIYFHFNKMLRIPIKHIKHDSINYDKL